jgi:hypothetical protein
MTYLDKDMVEFVTPAGMNGLGTASRLAKDAQPIQGMAMLAFDDDDLNDETTMVMVHLSMRLPDAQKALGPVILKDTERRNMPALIPAKKAAAKKKTS